MILFDANEWNFDENLTRENGVIFTQKFPFVNFVHSFSVLVFQTRPIYIFCLSWTKAERKKGMRDTNIVDGGHFIEEKIM